MKQKTFIVISEWPCARACALCVLKETSLFVANNFPRRGEKERERERDRSLIVWKKLVSRARPERAVIFLGFRVVSSLLYLSFFGKRWLAYSPHDDSRGERDEVVFFHRGNKHGGLFRRRRNELYIPDCNRVPRLKKI